MRLVLDTNVVASALLWHGPPNHLVKLATTNEALFFSSLPLLAELSDILSRSKFEKKIAASLLFVDQLVDLYAELVTLVRPVRVPRIAPDPDDDVVIGTAHASRADLIVTGDRTLLSVAQYDGGRIASVSEALHAIAAG
jgi:hypothetical protein